MSPGNTPPAQSTASTAASQPTRPRLLLMIVSIASLIWVFVARVSGPDDAWDAAQPKTLSYTTDMIVNGGVHWLLPIERGEYPATKPPMYNWLAAPAVILCGIGSEIAHKLPSLAAMAVCWVVLVRVGRALGDESLGWLAGLVFCSNALVFKLGYLARPDMLLTAWVCCGWVAATAVFVSPPIVQASKRRNLGEKRSDRWTRVFWLSVALAALTKGPAAIILPIFAVLAARFVGGSWGSVNRLQWWIGIPFSLTAFGLWLWTVWQLDPGHVLDTLWQAEIYGRVTGSGPEGSREGWVAMFMTLPTLGAYILARFAPWWMASLGALVMLWQRRATGGAPRSASGSAAAQARCDPRRAPAPPLDATTRWMRGSAVLALTVIALFGLSASTRADYLAPAVPPASLLAAWWMREVRTWRLSESTSLRSWRAVPPERPWLPATIAAVTLMILTLINRLEPNAPTRGFGDEIDRFIDHTREQLAARPFAVGFWRVGSEHGGLQIQAFLGLSQSEDPLILKSQLEELTSSMWVIAGRRDSSPQTFPEWLAQRGGSFAVAAVEQTRPMPQGRSAFPDQLTLYLVKRQFDD